MNSIALGLIFAVSVYAGAMLAACEFGLLRLRYGWQPPADKGWASTQRRLDKLTNSADRTARVLRLGRFTFGLAGGLSLFGLFWGAWESLFPEGAPASKALIALGCFLPALIIYYLAAELLPRGWAVSRPASALRHASVVVTLVFLASGPFIKLVRALKVLFYRRYDWTDDINPMDVEVQIRAMGENQGVASPIIRSIVRRTLRIHELVAQDIVLPRGQVQYFDLNDSVEENLKLARETGHTRFPLCDGDLDHCVGIIHIKDIFRQGGAPPTGINLRKLRRNITRFDTETPLDKALERLLRLRMHMALVVDSFGGTMGIVTLERILEEMVGEIQDEFDQEEDRDKRIVPVQQGPDTVYQITGLTPLHDVEQVVQCDFENPDVSTLGGLITAELGHIPEKGETLTVDCVEITVDEVDERRVILATVRRLPDDSEEDESLSGNPAVQTGEELSP